ncbi:hypothetical protein HK105_204589 [Polyrhizophydium stewartii]|uniref:Non-haem dioxygenase N-terminal domain-containing protein n=1 Tax=Polyrhizophydium stewartii TaxID=2732419 RepID=A0ABR4N8N5_9FUNG
MADVIALDYAALADPSADLSGPIAAAFGSGSGCLGACFVRGVPGFPELRQRLLRLASVFAALPEDAKQAVVHTPSSYLFGWSHGKEIMNGKPDTAKGSYYNNPIRDVPPKSRDPDYIAKFPEYGFPNVWPKELPELREAFMELGQLIVDVGKLVAAHCDKYLVANFPDIPANFMERAIAESDTIKARLLHYFPISKEDATPKPDGSNMDSWCGLHVDHSMLTGLTSAMYVDESNGEIKDADKSNPDVAAALEPAGLYIQSRGSEFVQVKIPADCLAFQIGEAAQVGSRGLLVATPHLVRGAAYPNLARNTFAVFMQPNVDYPLTADKTFNDFTKEVMKRHYEPIA